MESASYVVFADGTHTDTTTGIRRRVKAGDVITMQLAVNLGLAGAALPDAPTHIHGIGPALVTDPQDGDTLVYDSDSGTWINAPPVASGGGPDDDVSLVFNGRFESALVGIGGWDRSNNQATLTRETADPIAGTGSLKVHVASDFGGCGAVNTMYAPFEGATDEGATYRISFKLRGEGNLILYLDSNAVADIDGQWTGTATTEVQEVSTDFVLPAGAELGSMQIQILTSWDGDQNDIDFWIDDVVFKKVEAP